MHAMEAGVDEQVDTTLRVFMYLPFEHAEDMACQERSVALMTPLGKEFGDYASAHHDVIARFGRFPHRNRALGCVSTVEEQAWLDAGSGF